MPSDCIAAIPHSISSYAWKTPGARPALFKRAENIIAGIEKSGHPSQLHPSIPWKAYLASREFQHLASELADSFFARAGQPAATQSSRPLSLSLGSKVAGAAGHRLLQPVTGVAGQRESHAFPAPLFTSGLQIAA